MRKQIDLPDNILTTLKKVAKEDSRSVKAWMEHVIIKEIQRKARSCK